MTPSQQPPSQQPPSEQPPSQQLRSTRGRTRTAVTASSAVVMLGASLLLSACGAQQPGAAAVVNGDTIRDQDVQRIALDLKQLSPDQKQADPGKVLGAMIIAPYILAEAKRTGHDVTDAQARTAIAKGIPNPSPQTVDLFRSQVAVQFLDQAAAPNILTKLGKAEITVNPRYGTVNPRFDMLDVKQALIIPTVPNWMPTSPAAK
jgi:hypothetical protein